MHNEVEPLGSKVIPISVAVLVCLVGFLTSSSTTRLYRGRAPRQERLTILRAATHETELGDHDFCLSRSHYTDTDPTCRERAATAGIEPGTSSPGVARSTAELPRPPPPPPPPPQSLCNVIECANFGNSCRYVETNLRSAYHP